MERVYIKYDPKKNLPTHEAIITHQIDNQLKKLASTECVTNEANHNLTPSQKDLLCWYFRLGHIGFQHVQWLILTGRLKVKGNTKSVANCESTKCDSCEFGKVHHKYNKVNTIKNNPTKEQYIKKENLLPVHMVSADHTISRATYRLYHKNVKSDPYDMFSR